MGDSPPAIIQSQPTNNQQTNVVINQKDMNTSYLLAATIWGEGRGEGEVGMHAILNVILNRAHGNIRNAGNVVLKPKQFSCWNNIHDPSAYSQKLAEKNRSDNSPDGMMYKKAISLVDLAMKDKLNDITQGAQFYFNPQLASPSWAKKLDKTVSIGHHDFYKLKK